MKTITYRSAISISPYPDDQFTFDLELVAPDAGTANGGVVVNVDPTVDGNYTFNLNGQTNETGVFTGLAAGSYILVITRYDNVKISYPVLLYPVFALTAVATSETAVGAGDGTITLEVDQPGVFAYTVTGVGTNSTGLFTGLDTGTYEYSVTNGQDTLTGSIEVLVVPVLTITSTPSTDETTPDGTITIVATPSGSYEYTIAGVGTNTTGIFTGLLPALYSISVTNGVDVVVGSGEVGITNTMDVHAELYITAEEITNETHKAAINELVINLKAINDIDPDFVNFEYLSNSKTKAIYPFVGNGALNTRNLLNPADNDAAFRITWSATPSFTEKGVNFQGTKWGDTKLNARTNLSNEHHEIDIYITDYIKGTASANRPMEIGARVFTTQWESITLAVGAGTPPLYIAGFSQFWSGNKSLASAQNRTVNTIGLWQLNKQGYATGQLRGLRNTKLIEANTTIESGSVLPNLPIFVGRNNGNTEVSLRTFGWARIGDYISDAVNVLYLKAIETYQYRLGRLPLKNIIFMGHSFCGETVEGSIYTSIPGYCAHQLLTSGKDIYNVYNGSSGGFKVPDLISYQEAWVTANTKNSSVVPFENIMVLFIGVNDLSTNRDGITTYNLIKNYVQSQLTLGFKVFVYTITPSTLQNLIEWDFEDQRNICNDLMRNDLSLLSNCYILDTDLIPETADANNLTYYSDKIHPTSLLKTMLGNAFISRYNIIFP